MKLTLRANYFVFLTDGIPDILVCFNSFILTDVVFPFYFTINLIGKTNENTFTISSLQNATKNNVLVQPKG